MTASPASASVHRRVLAGWGNYPRAESSLTGLVQPANSADAWRSFDSLTPRGLGRSYGDAALPTADGLALATAGMHQVLDFDAKAGVLTAEAGASLHLIIERIVPRGWWLPVTPGTRQVTLGGAVAANVHGKNHHRVGAIANFVQRLSVLTELGPRECSPTESADLFRATLGGFGQTGLVQQVTLRLAPIETAWMTATAVKVQNWEELLAVLDEREQRHESVLCWIDTLAAGRRLGRGMVFLGDHARANDLDAARQRQPLARNVSPARRLPSLINGWCLNAWTNRLFNAAVWRRQPTGVTELVALDRWFYPLDGLEGWNRLYGRRGFLQYHFSVPKQPSGAQAVRQVLEHLQRRGVGSFVAGLKTMQADQVLLPFGQAGYTLGMDFGPRTRELHALLDELDQIVQPHGGRVCLSKDARLSAAMFRAMYPEYRQWLETVRRFAPSGRFSSRMAERLGWREPPA